MSGGQRYEKIDLADENLQERLNALLPTIRVTEVNCASQQKVSRLISINPALVVFSSEVDAFDFRVFQSNRNTPGAWGDSDCIDFRLMVNFSPAYAAKLALIDQFFARLFAKTARYVRPMMIHSDTYGPSIKLKFKNDTQLPLAFELVLECLNEDVNVKWPQLDLTTRNVLHQYECSALLDKKHLLGQTAFCVSMAYVLGSTQELGLLPRLSLIRIHDLSVSKNAFLTPSTVGLPLPRIKKLKDSVRAEEQNMSNQNMYEGIPRPNGLKLM